MEYRVNRAKLSFVFGAADTVKSQDLNFTGQMKHLHLRVPNFTNAVTATVTLTDADGYTVYTSAAKARNANYNLEADAEWFDQLVSGGTYNLVVTLSGVPGGTGGTVIAALRILGARWA